MTVGSQRVIDHKQVALSQLPKITKENSTQLHQAKMRNIFKALEWPYQVSVKWEPRMAQNHCYITYVKLHMHLCG